MRDDDARDAGAFSEWLTEMQGALRGERDAVVPCAGCTACCTSSQFVHIAPDETATLARIPAELLFPAPRMPRGHMVLGYDEHGRCPMLVDDACSIYEDRPQTCRNYDCRIYAATGVEPDDDKPLIAAHVHSWRFDLAAPGAGGRQAAVFAAVSFLRTQRAASRIRPSWRRGPC